MNPGYRQEVLNVSLARLLSNRGVVAVPEFVLKLSPTVQRKMPDVMVSFQGLRTVIEGEVNDQANAHERALASASSRVEDGIAHIGIAVVYPAMLRTVNYADLDNKLASSELNIAIVTESEKSQYVPGNVNYLESALRRAFQQLVEEDVVAKAVVALEAGIENFAGELATRGGDVSRVANALGIREFKKIEEPEEES